MSKIFVVSSSFRKGGNSDVLAEAFARGARESGNSVTKVNIRDLELKFCIGCLSCQRTGKCVLKDSVASLLEPISESDVLVFATPIYYYEMAGQLKTFLDRMNPLFSKKNQFRRVYLLAAAADGGIEAIDGARQGVEGWVSCFEGVTLDACVLASEATDVGDIDTTSAAAVEAYEIGRAI